MAGERTRTVAVRLTPTEHAAWLAAATAAGRGRLGSWARDQIAASLAAPPAGGAAPVEVAAVSGVGAGVLPAAQVREQLARVGNLLNQAVRLGHGGGLDAQVAEQLIASVVATRRALMDVHGDLAGRS